MTQKRKTRIHRSNMFGGQEDVMSEQELDAAVARAEKDNDPSRLAAIEHQASMDALLFETTKPPPREKHKSNHVDESA